jgi:hypothetical protein
MTIYKENISYQRTEEDSLPRTKNHRIKRQITSNIDILWNCHSLLQIISRAKSTLQFAVSVASNRKTGLDNVFQSLLQLLTDCFLDIMSDVSFLQITLAIDTSNMIDSGLDFGVGIEMAGILF